MHRVILQVIPGHSVNQHSEPATIFIQPRNQLIELRRIKGELTTPPRMRPDRLLVHATHRNAKQLRGALANRTRLLCRLLVKVNVRVIPRE
jgi:hypothetical protein